MFWKVFHTFHDHNYPDTQMQFASKFWVMLKNIDFGISIRLYKTLRSVNQKACEKISEPQPRTYSVCVIQSLQQFYISKTDNIYYLAFTGFLHFKLSRLLRIFYISMLMNLRYLAFTEFLHFNDKGLRPFSSRSVLIY